MNKAETIKAIRDRCIDMGLDLVDQIAYVLATVEHETGGAFQPVKEAYWKSEAWRQAHLRYYPYYGRGYVQITWRANYEAYHKKLEKAFPDDGPIDLVVHPDLALEPKYALFILIDGFKTGIFTGKKITDYINEEDDTDFINARRCINGLDCAQKIAVLAKKYQEQLGKEA